MPRVSNNMPEAYVQERPGTGPLLQLIGANTTDKLLQVVDSTGAEVGSISAAGALSAKQFTNASAVGTQSWSGPMQGQQQPIIASGAAAVTLTAAQSGACFLFDVNSGVTYTLPVATTGNKGMWFDFVVTVTCTSAGHKVITGAGTELLIGNVVDVDTDTSNAVAVFSGDGATHISVNMTAAGTNAKGGMIGTKLRFTNLSTTRWFVEGIVAAAGTVTTPFSNS